MRKKAQNKNRGAASPASSSSNCGSSASNNPTADTLPMQDATGESFYDMVGPGKGCSMEDIWGDIVSSEENAITPATGSYASYDFAYPPIASPTWELDTGTQELNSASSNASNSSAFADTRQRSPSAASQQTSKLTNN